MRVPLVHRAEGKGNEITSTAKTSPRLHTLVLSAMIVAACFMVYCNTLSNGFVYDDNTQILESRWIRSAQYLPEIFSKSVAGATVGNAVSYYRPMMYVIYIGNYFMFGLHPWGYHLVSILLHSCVSVLVFLLVSRLLAEAAVPAPFRQRTSFVAALLFATHTIHSEAIAWAAAVPDLSYSLFYLLSLLLYLRGTAERNAVSLKCYAGSLVAFLVSTLCKEPSVTLPLVIMVYDLACRKLKFPRGAPWCTSLTLRWWWCTFF